MYDNIKNALNNVLYSFSEIANTPPQELKRKKVNQ